MTDKIGKYWRSDLVKRDAIHIAIAPAKAAEDISPGDRVTYSNGLAVKAIDGHGDGIADPYIGSVIPKDYSFYIFLYPGQITSIRHEWAHPSFESKQESEQWLREFCKKSDCPDYETVIKAVKGLKLKNPDPKYYTEAYRIDKEYFHFNGIDAHAKIPPEFWVHCEVVIGRKIDVRPPMFTCSC